MVDLTAVCKPLFKIKSYGLCATLTSKIQRPVQNYCKTDSYRSSVIPAANIIFILRWLKY